MHASSIRSNVFRGGAFLALCLVFVLIFTASGQQGIFVNFSNEPSRIPLFLGEGRAVAVGDVDGDGDIDMFIGTDDGNARDRLMINNGDGQFEDDTTRRLPSKSGFAFTEDAHFIDIDNDGDLDIIVAQGRPDGTGDQNLMFVNNGQGFFANETLLRIPGGPTGPMDQTYGVAVGDVNGDGFLDIYVANAEAGNVRDQLLINDGSGRFRDGSSALPTSSTLLHSISPVFGDVDGDGDLDLWIGTGGSQERVPHLYINDGQARFDDQTEFRLSTEAPANAFASEFIDIDGDSDLDIVYCNKPGRARLLVNTGSGFFRDETELRLPFDAVACTGIAIGDFNEDGATDIALGRDPDDNLQRANLILINDGTGHFIASPLLQGEGGGFSTAFFDADGDGDLDLVFLNKLEHQFWINRLR